MRIPLNVNIEERKRKVKYIYIHVRFLLLFTYNNEIKFIIEPRTYTGVFALHSKKLNRQSFYFKWRLNLCLKKKENKNWYRVNCLIKFYFIAGNFDVIGYYREERRMRIARNVWLKVANNLHSGMFLFSGNRGKNSTLKYFLLIRLSLKREKR